MGRILFDIFCMCHVVVVNHMVRQMFDMMRFVSMRTCFSIRREYVTHIKFRVVSGISTVLSYIGQCDLIILVWVTTSMVYPCRVTCVGYVI